MFPPEDSIPAISPRNIGVTTSMAEKNDNLSIYTGHIKSVYSSGCNSIFNCWGTEMKIQDIKAIARQSGIKAGNMKKIDLVRAIQKAEGNNECFATSYVHDCNQMNCLWREDCVKSA